MFFSDGHIPTNFSMRAWSFIYCIISLKPSDLIWKAGIVLVLGMHVFPLCFGRPLPSPSSGSWVPSPLILIFPCCELSSKTYFPFLEVAGFFVPPEASPMGSGCTFPLLHGFLLAHTSSALKKSIQQSSFNPAMTPKSPPWTCLTFFINIISSPFL